MWSRILERQITLALVDSTIVIESPCGSPTLFSNVTMKDALKTRRAIGVQEKAIYFQAIGFLERLLARLTDKQLEAVFWRLVDQSQKDNRSPSNRELASFLGISEGVLRRRLRAVYEKLGLDPVKTNNFVVLNLERE